MLTPLPLLRWYGLLLLLALSGCAPTPPAPAYRIGFSQCTTGDAWRRAMLAGMQKELSFHPEVQFQMLDAHNDSDLQRRQVQELIQRKVDLLIISPNQSGPLTPLTEAAYSQGIPVIILDRRTTSKLYTAYVGGDNLAVGRAAAHYAARLLRQRGQVLEITGRPGSSPATDRTAGFGQALAAYPRLRRVARLAGDWQPASVLRQLPAVLRAHPEVNLIFAHNDPMARAAYQVVQQLGRGGRVRIIGVDGLPGPGNGLQLVEDGALNATLLYSPGGEEAIRTAVRILRHEPYAKENILGTMVVDSTNVGTMRAQTEQLAAQRQDLWQQQQRLQAERQRYASQRTAVYLLLASLALALGLGGLGGALVAAAPPQPADAGNAQRRNQRPAQPDCPAGRGGPPHRRRRRPRLGGQAAVFHQFLARAAHAAHPHSGAGGGFADPSHRPHARPAARPEAGAPQRPAPAAAGKPTARFP